MGLDIWTGAEYADDGDLGDLKEITFQLARSSRRAVPTVANFGLRDAALAALVAADPTFNTVGLQCFVAGGGQWYYNGTGWEPVGRATPATQTNVPAVNPNAYFAASTTEGVYSTLAWTFTAARTGVFNLYYDFDVNTRLIGAGFTQARVYMSLDGGGVIAIDDAPVGWDGGAALDGLIPWSNRSWGSRAVPIPRKVTAGQEVALTVRTRTSYTHGSSTYAVQGWRWTVVQ